MNCEKTVVRESDEVGDNRATGLEWARCEGVGTATSKWSHPLLLVSLSDGPLLDKCCDVPSPDR